MPPSTNQETWNVEIREFSCWETIEVARSELEAARIASILTLTIREEWIRVVDPNNKILWPTKKSNPLKPQFLKLSQNTIATPKN